VISPEQRAWIEAHAYLPEHLPGYVTSVSPAQVELVGDFIVYRRSEILIFIGYALAGDTDENRLLKALDDCRERFTPSQISFIGPNLPPELECQVSGRVWRDGYFRLDLSRFNPSKKNRSLLKRASRDLHFETTYIWTDEHQRLVHDFIRSHTLDQGTRSIFTHLSKYVKAGAPIIFQVKDHQGGLNAFDIADFSAGDYAFYMFNFCSRKAYIPGASDLLLAKIIAQAQSQSKRFLNLGLGINPGVTFFKKKWGAEHFLDYCACLLKPSGLESVGNLVDSFLR
jgi:hypothetical protein